MGDLNSGAPLAVRRPAAAIKINGTVVPGWLSWEVDNNVMRAADTFSAEFAVAALPSATSLAWLFDQKEITVEIFATTDTDYPYRPAAADRLIYGRVDAVEYHADQGTVSLSGRDLTSLFIDTKTSENHQNQTSSQVATLLAQRCGLTPVVTATSTKIGKFYAVDHTDINQEESEWDLLTKLAGFEGFNVFVTGNELHFEPKPEADGDRYVIRYVAPTSDAFLRINATVLSFSRDLTIAKGITVEVRSWNAKQKKAFTASWPRAVKGARPGQAASSATPYHFSIAGLTQDQAYDRAQKIYNSIVDRLVRLAADMPGDALLTCDTVVDVRGTGTSLDQLYYPDSVKRSMLAGEGYRMALTARSVSQDVEAG